MTVTNRIFGSITLGLLLVGVLVVGPTRAADWPARPSNPNLEFVVEGVPDVVIHDPDVDLLAYLASQGHAVENYSPPLIVPGAAYQADSQTSDYFFSFGSGMFNSTDGCYMVPIYLPHGATVDNFFVFALDNSTADISFNFWRKRTLDTSAPELMGTVTTSGAATTIQVLGDTTIDNALVSQDYAYYATHCHTGASQGIQALWLFYIQP